MKSKYHNYDASIHKIVNGKIVNKSVRELIEDQKKRDQAARELSSIGIKITAFWKKLLTDGVVWCRIYPQWTTKLLPCPTGISDTMRLCMKNRAPILITRTCATGTMPERSFSGPIEWFSGIWKIVKSKKSCWLLGGVMVKYFQLMGPEGIRLATYQLTANSESASQ